MTDETSGSTVPRRQLGRLLGRFREEALVTLDGTAEAMDCSRQKIWRIEKGMVPVRLPDLKVMCELYGVTDEMRRVVTGLAKETRAKGWWHSYGDSIPEWFSLFVGLEAAASVVRQYDGDLIPGLLQTRGYMTELFRRDQPDATAAERERAIAVRLKRQNLLIRRLPAAPGLDVVLSEAALRRPVPDHAAMSIQLRHLIGAMDLPNVTLRVLPLAAGPPPGSTAGTFVILDFPPARGRNTAEPTTVYVEGLTGALYLDKPSEVAAYERAWRGLETLALDEGESRRMIGEIIGEFDE
jgi:transcriptional regulator with XRE-family HTH domain